METNKTILMREIVSLEDRETVGTVKDLIVDCMHNKVGHFLVSDSVSGAVSLLALDDIIAIGDPYITIRSKRLMTPETSTLTADIMAQECSLIGIEMLSEAGNHFSFVRGFEFDEKTGSVTSLTTYDNSSVDAQSILFLSPQYIFVGSSQALEGAMRRPASQSHLQPIPEPVLRPQPQPQPQVQPAFSAEKKEESKPIGGGFQPPKPASSGPSSFSSQATSSMPAVHPSQPQQPSSGAKDDLSDLLVGAVVGEDITSKDGLFTVKKGTTITKDILANAERHDATLLLTMSVDV